jgi:hypothetical protein
MWKVQNETLVRYNKQISAFTQWARRQVVSGDLELLVEDYIQHVAEQSLTRGALANMRRLLSALNFHLPRRLPFKRAWQALDAWDRVVPAERKLPMAEGVMRGVAAYWGRTGRTAEACLLIISFYHCLRVSEMRQIRAEVIELPGSQKLRDMGLGKEVTLITIPHTKTGQPATLICRLPVVIQAARYLKELKGWDVWCFNSLLKKAFLVFGYGLHMTNHSLRRGGAVYWYMRGMTIEQVMEVGRWAARESLKHYLTQGKLMLAQQASVDWRIPDRVAETMGLTFLGCCICDDCLHTYVVGGLAGWPATISTLREEFAKWDLGLRPLSSGKEKGGEVRV